MQICNFILQGNLGVGERYTVKDGCMLEGWGGGGADVAYYAATRSTELAACCSSSFRN